MAIEVSVELCDAKAGENGKREESNGARRARNVKRGTDLDRGEDDAACAQARTLCDGLWLMVGEEEIECSVVGCRWYKSCKEMEASAFHQCRLGELSIIARMCRHLLARASNACSSITLRLSTTHKSSIRHLSPPCRAPGAPLFQLVTLVRCKALLSGFPTARERQLCACKGSSPHPRRRPGNPFMLWNAAPP